MSLKSRKLILVVLGFVSLCVFAVGQGFARIQAAEQESLISGPPRGHADIIVVTFASQWCGPCKILKPRLAAVKPEFSEKSVRFVELNFTFGEKHEYSELAALEGFSEAYKNYRSATGFSVVVNRNGGQVLDVLTANYSKSAMRAAISRALAIAKAEQGARIQDA